MDNNANSTFSPTFTPTYSPTNDTTILGKEGIGIIVFFIVGVGIGSLTGYFGRIFSFPIPYPVLIFFEGIGLAFVIKGVFPTSAINIVESTSIAADLIVYVFLPILLFGEVKNLNWHHVKGGFNQALFMAGPGAVVSAMLLGALFSAAFPGWEPKYIYYVLGSILAATDPVSTVALLKSTGASSKLTIVIVGESLLNDGAAMILFFFFSQIVITGEMYTAASFFEFVAVKLLASPVVGVGFGLLAIFVSKKIYEDWNLTDINVQIIITLICGYVSFYVGEGEDCLDGSGVLSVCGAGAMYSWLCSPKILQDHAMHEAWDNLEWLCNTLIFLLGGVIAGGETLTSASPSQYGYLVLLFVFLQVVRFLMVGASHFIILRGTIKDSIFTAFAGIRGALAIALALQFKHSLRVIGISQHDDGGSFDVIGDQFYFFVSGLAALTLLINGTVAEPLLLSLQLVEDPLKPKSPEMMTVLNNVKRAIRRHVREELSSMEIEVGRYDSTDMSRLCSLMRPSIDDDDAYEPSKRLTSSKISPDLLAYVRTTFLETVRSYYRHAVHSGKIGTQSSAAQLLLYTVDKALDHCADPTRQMGDLESLERNLKPNAMTVAFANFCDNAVGVVGISPVFTSYIDAWTERRALFTLTNFIDAHTFAQSKLHIFLGAPAQDTGNWLPEEANVMASSEAAVARAKRLIALIDAKYVQEFFIRRTARVALIRQREIIEEMVEEGALSEKWGAAMLGTIEADSIKMNKEMQSSHRTMLHQLSKTKLSNKDLRESLNGGLLDGDNLVSRPSLRESLQVKDFSTSEYVESGPRPSFSSMSRPSIQFGLRSSFSGGNSSGIAMASSPPGAGPPWPTHADDLLAAATAEAEDETKDQAI